MRKIIYFALLVSLYSCSGEKPNSENADSIEKIAKQQVDEAAHLSRVALIFDSLKKYSWAVENIQGKIGAGNGSCFFYKKNGETYLITNKHVAKGSNALWILEKDRAVVSTKNDLLKDYPGDIDLSIFKVPKSISGLNYINGFININTAIDSNRVILIGKVKDYSSTAKVSLALKTSVVLTGTFPLDNLKVTNLSNSLKQIKSRRDILTTDTPKKGMSGSPAFALYYANNKQHIALLGVCYGYITFLDDHRITSFGTIINAKLLLDILNKYCK
jgi:hypothetical protein